MVLSMDAYIHLTKLTNNNMCVVYTWIKTKISSWKSTSFHSFSLILTSVNELCPKLAEKGGKSKLVEVDKVLSADKRKHH